MHFAKNRNSHYAYARYNPGLPQQKRQTQAYILPLSVLFLDVGDDDFSGFCVHNRCSSACRDQEFSFRNPGRS